MERFRAWCADNSAKGKTTRTIAQGVIGVVIAYLDAILGFFVIPDELRPIIAAGIMAILSPIQAYIGGEDEDTDGIGMEGTD